MNERIKKLAEEARLLHERLGPSIETRYMRKKEQELERFADLIIMECARVVKASSPQGMIAVNAIRIHFGVEP
jgi:hypothetical protein